MVNSQKESAVWGTLKIKLEFGNIGFLGEGKTEEPREKPLGARARTNNKLNPNTCMMTGQGIKPGPQWWKPSAHTTAPSLFPNTCYRILWVIVGRSDLTCLLQNVWFCPSDLCPHGWQVGPMIASSISGFHLKLTVPLTRQPS